MIHSNAFLSGKVVDENGKCPRTACYHVVTEGTLRGQSGFVCIHENQLKHDGSFLSPRLPPRKYLLRFFGMLWTSPSASMDESSSTIHDSVFDFFYPDAQTVSSASPFELGAGELMNLLVRVPKPARFNISGRIIGDLPAERSEMVIMFQRDTGVLGGEGGEGLPVDEGGEFAGKLLRGSYSVSGPPHDTSPRRRLLTIAGAVRFYSGQYPARRSGSGTVVLQTEEALQKLSPGLAVLWSTGMRAVTD